MLEWDRCVASKTGALNLLLQNFYDDKEQKMWKVIKQSAPVRNDSRMIKRKNLPHQAGTEQKIN